LKIPPPVHGSTLMNQQVLQSKAIREPFDARYFPLTLSREVSEIGKFSWQKFRKTVSDFFSLYRTMKSFRPSIVYFTISPSGAALFKDFIFYRIVRFFKTPVIFHHHGKGVKLNGDRNKIYNRIYRNMFRSNDHICLSKEGMADVEPYISRPAYIVPNGIADNAGTGEKPLRTGNPCRILFLSNFMISKGILDTIDACKILNDKNFSFELWLVGKSYDVSEAELSDRINQSGLTNKVKVIGPKYNEDKYEIIRECDFFVFPTKYEKESFPLVILEAFQFGLPVISSFEGAIPSMICPDNDGYLVKKNDIGMLAEKMSLLIENPSRIRTMGLKARRKFESLYTLTQFEQHVKESILNSLNSNGNDKKRA
jgi:glycosyltransferase involved in cell wall biosynthesis